MLGEFAEVVKAAGVGHVGDRRVVGITRAQQLLGAVKPVHAKPFGRRLIQLAPERELQRPRRHREPSRDLGERERLGESLVHELRGVAHEASRSRGSVLPQSRANGRERQQERLECDVLEALLCQRRVVADARGGGVQERLEDREHGEHLRIHVGRELKLQGCGRLADEQRRERFESLFRDVDQQLTEIRVHPRPELAVRGDRTDLSGADDHLVAAVAILRRAREDDREQEVLAVRHLRGHGHRMAVVEPVQRERGGDRGRAQGRAQAGIAPVQGDPVGAERIGEQRELIGIAAAVERENTGALKRRDNSLVCHG
ncbi:MAG: hypothetical protein R2732_04410 [Microbacteriaceae bacterium]|nr:hypothetical protein [Microbacteriaceae bacterium]HPZ34537.1 hypothetical protein [Microbacteriaceae bacterium]HQC92300.1 hypothetical protein [Microbacteriaceae bacterium]